MQFVQYDNGNCRAYYKDGKNLYCVQDETSFGRPSFKFYLCSRDGEPSHEVTCPLADMAAEYAGYQTRYRETDWHAAAE